MNPIIFNIIQQVVIIFAIYPVKFVLKLENHPTSAGACPMRHKEHCHPPL